MGLLDGSLDGFAVGLFVGLEVGLLDGRLDGLAVGPLVLTGTGMRVLPLPATASREFLTCKKGTPSRSPN